MGSSLRLALVAYCMLAAGPGLTAAERREFTSDHMGTRFALTLYCDDGAKARAAAEAAFARVAEIERALTDYDPKSEAMRVCRRNDAAPGVPIPVSDDLFACLKVAREVAELTGGKFDPTVGPLTKLWRLSRRTQEPIDPATLKAALAKVGYRHYRLDAAKRTVTFDIPGVRLDFGGVGKGFAADEVLKLLRTRYGLTQACWSRPGAMSPAATPRRGRRGGWSKSSRSQKAAPPEACC